MRYEDLEDISVQTSLGTLHCKRHRTDGKKIVFLHGFGASTKSFSRLAEQLPDELCVYLVDLLGHGESDAPRIQYTVGKQAQAVKELMQSLDLQESCIFGHSYGGWVAALIAQGNYKGDGIILEDAMGLKEIFDDIEKTDAKAWKEKWIAEALIFNPRDWVIRSSANDQPASEYLTKEGLSSIVKPALVIWGSDDKTLDVKYAKMFNNYIKGSVLEIVQDAGHVAHYAHAGAVADLIKEFVS